MSIRRTLIGAALVAGLIAPAAAAIRDRYITAAEPTFTGHRSPRRTRNGGTASGAAAAKRAKRRRRNIAKNPRGAA